MDFQTTNRIQSRYYINITMEVDPGRVASHLEEMKLGLLEIQAKCKYFMHGVSIASYVVVCSELSL